MESELINKAYAEGFKLKNAGFDEETIYAKLEKQGFGKELAKQVANDLIIERDKEDQHDKLDYFRIGIGVLCLGLILLLVSILFVPGYIIFPGGFIIGGSVMALANYPKRN